MVARSCWLQVSGIVQRQAEETWEPLRTSLVIWSSGKRVYRYIEIVKTFQMWWIPKTSLSQKCVFFFLPKPISGDNIRFLKSTRFCHISHGTVKLHPLLRAPPTLPDAPQHHQAHVRSSKFLAATSSNPKRWYLLTWGDIRTHWPLDPLVCRPKQTMFSSHWRLLILTFQGYPMDQDPYCYSQHSQLIKIKCTTLHVSIISIRNRLVENYFNPKFGNQSERLHVILLYHYIFCWINTTYNTFTYGISIWISRVHFTCSIK